MAKIDFETWERLARQERYSLRRVARRSGLSARTLTRTFQDAFGINPHEWFDHLRFQRAADLLSKGESPIKEIAHVLGYTTPSAFCRAFRKKAGISPRGFQTFFVTNHAGSVTIGASLTLPDADPLPAETLRVFPRRTK